MSKEKFRIIYDTSEETRIKELARMREKALHDEATYLREAKEEGRIERENEIIARMKAIGYSDDDIKGIFGL